MKNTLALCACLCLLSTSAFAHVTANPDHGPAGQYFQTSFRVSHGCEESDTVSIHVELPKGFLSVSPQFKPGWTVKIDKRKLPKPITGPHGKSFSEEVTSVTWSGNVLPHDQYDEFGLVMKLPDATGKLWFPVIQTCHKGENAWTMIPKGGQQWHDVESPAPFVNVESEDDMNGMMHDMPGMSH